MKQLTLRGFDPSVERALTKVAQEKQWSLNRAALYLIRRGADLLEDESRPRTVGRDVDRLIGSWSAEEAEEFENATHVFEAVDEGLWS